MLKAVSTLEHVTTVTANCANSYLLVWFRVALTAHVEKNVLAKHPKCTEGQQLKCFWYTAGLTSKVYKLTNTVCNTR